MNEKYIKIIKTEKKPKYLCLELKRSVNLKSLYEMLKSKLFNDNNITHPHDLEMETLKTHTWQDLAKILLIADKSWHEKKELYYKYDVIKPKFKLQKIYNNKIKQLEELFELQIKFQKLLGNDIIHLSKYEEYSNETIELIKNQILALFDETAEVLREVPWKVWKKNQQFNLSKFRMELIDAFHFLINLFLLSGMDSNDVVNLFKQKNKINVRRQEDGY